MNMHISPQSFVKAAEFQVKSPIQEVKQLDLRAIAKQFETDNSFKKARADAKLFDVTINDGLSNK